jgi:hypothetical protein
MFAFLALAAASVFAQTESTPITASSVWQPGGNFLAQAHAACDKGSPSQNFGACVVNQMPKAGAPADAVSFTRELFKLSGGEVGIMTGFQKVGPVDIAWVSYPLRSSYGLMLVNGKPRIVNAEDLKQLDQKTMRQSFQFQDLQNQFPSVNLWPGDRDGQTWPNSQTGPNGGVQFTIGYPLRNGCQTCAHAGDALFNWNFNSSGKFTGTSFQGMTPAPLGHPSAGSPSQQ